MARGGARKGAGRPKGSVTIWTPEQVDRFRARIQTDQIIQRLNSVATGKIQKQSSGEVTAALGLLRKVIPDLSSVQHSGQVAVTRASEISDDALANIAAGSGAGAAEPSIDPQKLN